MVLWVIDFHYGVFRLHLKADDFEQSASMDGQCYGINTAPELLRYIIPNVQQRGCFGQTKLIKIQFKRCFHIPSVEHCNVIPIALRTPQHASVVVAATHHLTGFLIVLIHGKHVAIGEQLARFGRQIGQHCIDRLRHYTC